MKSPLLFAASMAVLPFAIHASTFHFGFNDLQFLVPDGDSSGLAKQFVIPSDIGTLLDVNVRLLLQGVGGTGYNGDLYAWLQHDTGFSVLLNRSGRDTGNPDGYADNGYYVWLDDEAPQEIHTYREVLGGSFPLSSPVVGSWRPDGREIDPANAVTGDSRTALLNSFDGLDAGGAWTLFIADLQGGGEVELVGCELILRTTLEVPDSSAPCGIVIGAVLLWAGIRRSRFERERF